MGTSIEPGRFHDLLVVEELSEGILLDAEGRDLFLPTHLAPDARVDDRLEVFIYVDRDGGLQATTKTPAATVGEFAYLRCASVTRAGAYLEWGIPKDLYVPPDEQSTPLREGQHYVAAICLDRKGERLIASTCLLRHFDYDVGNVAPDDEVDLLVHGHSDAGVQVVVARRHRGLIHRTDATTDLRVGDQRVGYVRRVRDDHRLDIGLTRRGVAGIHDAQDVILDALVEHAGTLPLHDRSSPEEIRRVLGLSKKAFKRGVGTLYKARKISVNDQEITLISKPSRRS